MPLRGVASVPTEWKRDPERLRLPSRSCRAHGSARVAPVGDLPSSHSSRTAHLRAPEDPPFRDQRREAVAAPPCLCLEGLPAPAAACPGRLRSWHQVRLQILGRLLSGPGLRPPVLPVPASVLPCPWAETFPSSVWRVLVPLWLFRLRSSWASGFPFFTGPSVF